MTLESFKSVFSILVYAPSKQSANLQISIHKHIAEHFPVKTCKKEKDF